MSDKDLSHLTPTILEVIRPEGIYKEMFLDLFRVHDALRRTSTYRDLSEECKKKMEKSPVEGAAWTVDVLVPAFLQELEGPIRTLARIVAFSLLHHDGEAPSYTEFREEYRYFPAVLEACSDAEGIDPELKDLLSMFEPGEKDSFGRFIRNAMGHADFEFENDDHHGPQVHFRGKGRSIGMGVDDFVRMFDATQDAAVALAKAVDDALQQRAAERD